MSAGENFITIGYSGEGLRDRIAGRDMAKVRKFGRKFAVTYVEAAVCLALLAQEHVVWMIIGESFRERQ
ncbi:hypothetical protein D0B32_02225 [Paraburkholderia sp. DHOC27]|nr:hypothetical protein D0B32_02225 [Paraburkholderia sp. DHOC27]